MTNITKLCAAAVLVSAPWLTGCAGARTTIVAPTAQYPVSMSRGMRDLDGSLVPAARRKIVGHFREKRKAWGMVWSFVSLTPTKDISEGLNTQIAAAKGDAVINLRMQATTCGSNIAVVLNILPFWPGCANVTIDGDIIQVLPAEGNAPAAAGASVAAASPRRLTDAVATSTAHSDPSGDNP